MKLPAATLALVLTFIATANISATKVFILYEPDTPKCLKK
ncbi:cyclic lactone autoinducer peptide [Thermosyntropha sp.]